jgi:Domain of unknown function (DUF4126)
MTDLPFIGIALGIGLAAATGFRVFIPLLALSLAAREWHVPLASGFEWIASTPALATFATAAVAEVLAYYIPGVDHLLDTLAAPAAVIAGIIVSASVMTDLPPYLKWSVALIAGGGIAGLTQGATTVMRAKSGIFTAGLGNPVVATGELVSAVALSVLALALPLIAAVVVVGLVVLAWRWLKRRAPARTAADT